MQSAMLSNHAANDQVEHSSVTQHLTPTSQKAFETYIDQSQFVSPDVARQRDVNLSMTQEQLEAMTLFNHGDLRLHTPPPLKNASLPDTSPVEEPEVDHVGYDNPLLDTEEDVVMEHDTSKVVDSSSGESEVESDDEDTDGVDDDEQPRRSQRLDGKKIEYWQMESEDDMDMDSDDKEDQQKEVKLAKLDSDIEMMHEGQDNSGNLIASTMLPQSNKPTKPDTSKAHNTHRKPTPPIEISEAGSPLPNLTPSPLPAVKTVAVKPKKALQSVPPRACTWHEVHSQNNPPRITSQHYFWACNAANG